MFVLPSNAVLYCCFYGTAGDDILHSVTPDLTDIRLLFAYLILDIDAKASATTARKYR